jgi:hypothetical protein
MRKLNKQHAVAFEPQTKKVLKHQIDAFDRQIDLMVYQLYHLTAAEIEIVEKSG